MLKEKITYLVMVTSEENHNKFYRMIPNVPDAAHFTAEYGRIGATGMKKIYPATSFEKIYDDKIRKGYVDQSDLHEEVVSVLSDNGYQPISDPMVSVLVEKLRRYADDTIKKSYKISSKEVTKTMLDTARQLIDELYGVSSISKFNALLLKLFSVIPRKMANVSDNLAITTADFGKIISSEESLLDVMAGQVIQNVRHNKPLGQKTTSNTILEENGLDIRCCTDAEIEQIKKFLGPESEGKLKRAFYVKNIETEERFNTYCKENHISRSNVKFLYHGSRNQNWWNILLQGLVLNPNAIRTGAMFGHGLYFAPRAKKSMKYTSYNGYYTGELSDTGFLAVYKVAYKNPLMVYSWESKYASYTIKDMKRLGTDAVFGSKEKGMLINDEIIVYDAAQATIRYLIELG